MLTYRTFTEHGGLTTKGVTEAQERARSAALAFLMRN